MTKNITKKNKNYYYPSSTKIHSSKPRYSYSNSRNLAKPVVLAVIFLSSIIIIVALVCAIFLKPERRVKETIRDLSAEYYEDYFYEKYISTANDPTIIQKYTESGLSPIPLRQLLLYDNQKNDEYADFLSAYCDEDNTYAVIYPDPPFDKKSYHMSFSYSCNF